MSAFSFDRESSGKCKVHQMSVQGVHNIDVNYLYLYDY